MSVKIRKRKLSDNTCTLYLDIYDSFGKRKVESLPLRLTGDKKKDKDIERLAETIRMKRELEVATSSEGIASVVKKNVNFIAYFEAISDEKQSNTAKTWKNTLNYLKKYVSGTLFFTAITGEWLTGFQKYLLRKVSPNTADIYFSKVKAALHRAIKEGILDKNPCHAVDAIEKLPTHRAYLTTEELTALVKTRCKYEVLKRAFLFACYTGLRRSDVEKLTWGEIEGNTIIYRQKKTKHAEYLPLNEVAIGFMGQRKDKNDLVFQDLPKRATIDKHVTQWAQEAGITKHVTFHVSRHTFATQALTYGADLYTVSKLLGHSDVKVTQIYTKIVDKKKVEAVNLLPKIG